MKGPELVNASKAELDELLVLAKASFPAQQYALLEDVFGTFVHVMLALQNAKTSLKRFRQMLFGARTESKHNLLGEQAAEATAATNTGDENVTAAKPKPPAVGHGRNGAQAYANSPVVEVNLPDLHSGDQCPTCSTGKIYDSAPRTIVRVVGQPPLAATVYKLQRVRCRLCDATFIAPMPEAAALPKYDHSSASMLALLRYGNGMPFYRLEGLQQSLNVPLPDSTQWDIVQKAAPGPRAAFNELIRQAAQAPLLHNDDTPAKILALMHERTKLERAGETPEAKAINTTGIVAVLKEHKIILFFTGHQHAGQNLAKVLAQRALDLAPPMQMADALACNFTNEFKTDICKCLTHGRRKLVELMEIFPEECRTVIETLADVYANDQFCRDKKLSDDERLLYHQAHSSALMNGLESWMKGQFDQHLVEPNSELGKAMRYLLNHWREMTLFLRKVGAPLDNTICERALKRAILHRKNSMFYKTCKGAEIGDIYMSLIYTCQICRVNPFEYLQALQAHVKKVEATAALWMPWNYREQLALAADAAPQA
jgi:transposase